LSETEKARQKRHEEKQAR
jgi:hypothetical protein